MCRLYLKFLSTFQVISLTGVGVGIWILVIKQKSITTALDLLLDLSVWLVIFGSIFGLISFFGCFGALREQITFLKIVSIIIFHILVLYELINA